jgi:integrase
MAGVRKKPKKGGKYQGWFVDETGTRKFFHGTRNRAETLRIAQRLEDEHRQIRLGYRPARTSADKYRHASFTEVKDEYIAWGIAQGGRDGRPWGKTHLRNRRTHLEWWQDQLGLETLADADGILPRVEEALRTLQAQGRAGKTLANYAEALAAFCDWCVQRGYLAADPLQSLSTFDTTPRIQRRAMTADEITMLLRVCAPHRRLLLETAFLSGLRANELRNLTTAHLDRTQCGLRLDAMWTKNRKPGFQPLPASLVERLAAFADSGEPSRLYRRFYSRHTVKEAPPIQPLLYVPSHPARELDKDLLRAGIPKSSPTGKLDFHACRVAYINLVLESGVSVKEAQTLARHATPHLTMNVYGRVREERLAQAVEHMAQSLLAEAECAPCVPHTTTDTKEKHPTPLIHQALGVLSRSGGGGNRTRVRKPLVTASTHALPGKF